MLSVRLLVNSRLLVAVFLGSQKLYVDFQLCEGSVSLNYTHTHNEYINLKKKKRKSCHLRQHGCGGHHPNEAGTERQILNDLTYMWTVKKPKS